MQFPVPAHEDITLLKGRFIADITKLIPNFEDSAARLFAGIARPNWGFEWGLPRWIGEALDLPVDVIRDLVLSNAYMLAFGRILDDVVDGERDTAVAASDEVLLSAGLQHLWISEYGMIFADAHHGSRKFWPYFHQYMSQWLGVLRPAPHPRHLFREYDAQDWETLAWQGAPLKVGCAAACLLGGREDAIPELSNAIDEIMIAVEMLDAVFDWNDDIEAGRHNPFVAFASELPQTPAHADENRRAVLEEIHLGSAGAPYFKLMYGRLQCAAERANKIPCSGLVNFARSLIDESQACAVALVEHATTRMDAALKVMKAESS